MKHFSILHPFLVIGAVIFNSILIGFLDTPATWGIVMGSSQPDHRSVGQVKGLLNKSFPI